MDVFETVVRLVTGHAAPRCAAAVNLSPAAWESLRADERAAGLLDLEEHPHDVDDTLSPRGRFLGVRVYLVRSGVAADHVAAESGRRDGVRADRTHTVLRRYLGRRLACVGSGERITKIELGWIDWIEFVTDPAVDGKFRHAKYATAGGGPRRSYLHGRLFDADVYVRRDVDVLCRFYTAAATDSEET